MQDMVSLGSDPLDNFGKVWKGRSPLHTFPGWRFEGGRSTPLSPTPNCKVR